jgi:alpha-L-fucosidase
MVRIAVPLAVLAVLSACGGGGGSSVKANPEEIKSRRDEIKAIADVPSDASKEAPTLLNAMNDADPEVRWLAEFGLGRVDESRGVKALIRALEDKSPKIRLAAAYVLGPMGRKARSAVPALLKTLSDPDNAVRVWTLKSLGDIDLRNPDVIAAAIKALRDPEPDVRRVALSTVIRLGPAATGVSTTLVDVLQDADAGIRAKACIAFRELGSDGKAGIPALITRLSDPELDVRIRATEALARIGPGGIPPLVRALKERDPRTRRAAAEILGTFGSEARANAVELGELSSDEDPGVRQAAADAIRKVQSDSGASPSVRGTSFIESPDAITRRAVGLRWAKVGLFVHWGLYSVPARAKPGQQSEWVMQNDKIPPKEYEHLALKFDAEKFKAEEWAKLANESGARYLILTAKHHDGFCLWNSKLTEYTSMRLAVAKRDLVGEVAAACEKEGVKFCASYSMLDWHHPDYETNFPKYVDFMHGQVKELVSGYPVWGVWFDGEWARSREEWRSDELVAMIRQAKPAAFINDRLGRDTRAAISGIDFYTREADVPPATLKLHGRPLAWEAALPFGESWGYCESPDPLKSGERMIVELVDAASRGGNFLINVSARRDGTIPEPFQARLKVVGAWLKKNADAIYDTERNPFPGRIPAGRVTVRGKRLFVFLEEYPADGIIALPGLKTKVLEAWTVDGKKELKVRENGIQAPDMGDGPFTAVAIELDGTPEFAR